MADETEGERHINKQKLMQLLAADKVARSKMAEERGAVAAKIKAAQESDNLDLWVYSVIKRFSGLPKATLIQRWRTLMLYGDMLGYADQADIEDYINSQPDTRTPHEKAMDGEPLKDEEVRAAQEAKAAKEAEREDAIADVLAGGAAAVAVDPKAFKALLTFQDVIASEESMEKINLGLDRISTDWPEVADQAVESAQERLRELAAQQGGGEDLRPRHMQEAEQVVPAPEAKARKRKAEGGAVVH